jgi:hypothetical protein
MRISQRKGVLFLFFDKKRKKDKGIVLSKKFYILLYRTKCHQHVPISEGQLMFLFIADRKLQKTPVVYQLHRMKHRHRKRENEISLISRLNLE